MPFSDEIVCTQLKRIADALESVSTSLRSAKANDPLTKILSGSRVKSVEPKQPLLTRKEAAEYLGISEQTLAIWKSTGRYNLPSVKVGRLVRYKKSALDEFVARGTVDG